MGGISDFFSFGGKTQVAADPYKDTREGLTSWLNPQIGQAGPKYQGEQVAPMSDAEKQSMEFLQKYGKQGMGSTFQNATDQINKTLTNQYDPTTSPYYQAIKAEAERNLGTVNKSIASNSAGAGNYFTGGRLKQQREASTDTYNNLNTTLGGLAAQERQNQLSVIPQALQAGQMEQNDPLNKAAALQQYGALPRNIQQSMDTASLEDWLRSEYQYPMDIAGMASNVQTPPTYQKTSPGMYWQLLNQGAQAAGAFAGAMK